MTAGIPWLGFRVFPTHRRLKRAQRQGVRAAACATNDAYRAGEIGLDKVQQSLQAWIAHARPTGDTAYAGPAAAGAPSRKGGGGIVWSHEPGNAPLRQEPSICSPISCRPPRSFPGAIAWGWAAASRRSGWASWTCCWPRASARAAERPALLREADVALDKLRFTVRLCQELGLLTPKQYQYAAGLFAETGKLLGAWLKRYNEP